MTIIALPQTEQATTPLGYALDHHSDHLLRAWLRTQPAPVVAVVDLAYLEDHAPIVNGLYPNHADTFSEMRAALVALDAESATSDREWIEQYAPDYIGAVDARGLVETLCDEMRGDVRVKAMFLASLITRGAA